MSLLRQKYELILSQKWTPGKGEVEARQRLNVIRRLILLDGLPPPTEEEKRDNLNCSLRGKFWKLLLNVHSLNTDEYLSLVRKGRSKVHSKISNDTFRTFPSDKTFSARVTQDQLLRVLSAFAHQNATASVAGPGQLSFSYVQGMNVLLAPLLYVMPEVDAYFTFTRLVRDILPMYVQPSLEGVHYSLQLMDECLEKVDPELFAYLRSKDLSAEIYGMPSMLTLCGCTPPLEEVLKLWDFLFAFGVHLCVLCTIAQLILIRDQILEAPSPMKLLRTLPDLKVKPVIALCVRLVHMIPDDMYDRLARHPFDRRLYPSFAQSA